MYKTEPFKVGKRSKRRSDGELIAPHFHQWTDHPDRRSIRNHRS